MLGTDRFVEAAAGPQIDALGCALGCAVSTVHYGSNLRSNDLKNYFLGSCVSCKVEPPSSALPVTTTATHAPALKQRCRPWLFPGLRSRPGLRPAPGPLRNVRKSVISQEMPLASKSNSSTEPVLH